MGLCYCKMFAALDHLSGILVDVYEFGQFPLSFVQQNDFNIWLIQNILSCAFTPEGPFLSKPRKPIT